ncbi:hypothetical protein [Thalassolituus maritimus]|uniref:Outer membrane protein beta-barrel domain-containing protein n=1 Tax=Thalassolituus maritimus TaxID=484498 RepID=A0ABP9ZXW8_9GAMM
MLNLRISTLALLLACGSAIADDEMATSDSKSVPNDEVDTHESVASIGLGLGVPYGFLGGNLAFKLNESVDLSLGLGGGIDTAFSFGGRMYPKETSKLRFSLLYGTNAYLEKGECSGSSYYSECELTYEGFNGLNLGVGAGPRAGERGWNIDLLLILTSDAFDEADRLEEEGEDVESDGGRVLFSFGYQWDL